MKKAFHLIWINLFLSILLAACQGQSIVIPWQGKTIEIVPRGAVSTLEEVVALTITNTPFMPMPNNEGNTGLTAVAEEQLNAATQTETSTLVLMSETPVEGTGTFTPIPSITLSSTLPTGTVTLTSTATHTKTVTLVLSSQTPSRTHANTTVPTQTYTQKVIVPQNTNTLTQTYTGVVENTNTFTPVVVDTPTFTATAAPSGCVYNGNTGYESTLIGLINELRTSLGLSPYSANSLLGNAARGHSQDMACNDYFDHTGLDGSTAASRVAAAGYSYSWVGENIYAGNGSYGTPQQAYDTWFKSPAHYANMTNANYTEIGIGFISCADSMYQNYFTANFARP